MSSPSPNPPADEAGSGARGGSDATVLAPFPAAPAEGSGVRLGWGIGIAGLVLVLCCGGGVAAVIGLFTTQYAAINEQAKVVVSEYLDALGGDDYDTAYDLLCGSQRQQVSKDEFAQRESSRPRPASYDVGEVTITPDSAIAVPVTERYPDGNADEATFYLEADEQTGQLKICGRE